METNILSTFKLTIPPGAAPTLGFIVDEVIRVIPKVEHFTAGANEKGQPQGNNGNALSVFRDGPDGEPVYRVNYTAGDIGNLLHELIHVCVDQAYNRDFMGYINGAVAPARVIDASGNCTNIGLRREAVRDLGREATVKGNLDDLKNLARLCTFKTSDQMVSKFKGSDDVLVHTKKETADWRKTTVMDKLDYAYATNVSPGPSIDYDTVLSQLLVFMYQFGYKTYKPTRWFGKVVRNSPSKEEAFLARLEFYAQEAYDDRQAALLLTRPVTRARSSSVRSRSET